jgi:hypothetical protein
VDNGCFLEFSSHGEYLIKKNRKKKKKGEKTRPKAALSLFFPFF